MFAEQPAVEAAQARTNPRRVAAVDSVSLKKKKQKRTTGPRSLASDQLSAGDVSAASIVAAPSDKPESLSNKHPHDTYNADKWFDDSNKHAAGKTNVRFIEDDPPFYLKKQRSSEDDGEVARPLSSSKDGNMRPQQQSFPAGPSQYCTDSSTSEDFRSVIDDLTVENQGLKKKLRKYQGLHCEHLQGDKLFEVRVYGLSQARRRKLEELLRDFVSNIGSSPSESVSPSTVPYVSSAISQRAPAAINTKRSTSSASNIPMDSAYASMSASNTASGSQTQNNAEPHQPISPPPAPRKEQRVQSYLQTISHGLLPKYPPFMTEKAKKRLVVRRLEQLFVGRGENFSQHSQSQQQQEVSQLAASADRKETEAMGHHPQAEGCREAKMLEPSQALVPALLEMLEQPIDVPTHNGNSSSAVTPDQRPTRPLDIDPSRAQNPAETISYMKHLGFASPKMDVQRSIGESEGWVYLNLLINMAQLHTVNVTADFVRTALSELSNKFELSNDGQNVRWKGDHRGSNLSNDGSQGSEGSSNSPPEQSGLVRGHNTSKGRNAKVESLGVAADGNHRTQSGNGTFRPLRHWPNSQNRANHQYYSPLFYYPEETVSGSPPLDASLNSANQIEDKSNDVFGESFKEHMKSSSHASGETGNLIFYRKARFCTDLKGDLTFPSSNLLYDKASTIIGLSQQRPASEAPAEARGALSSPDNLTFAATAATTVASDLDSTDLESFPSRTTTRTRAAKNLQASGLGGITPADNFCIDTTRAYARPGRGEPVGSELTAYSLYELDPAPLPPPSYAFPQFSSSSDGVQDGDDEDDGSSDDIREQYPSGVKHFASALNERHFVPPHFMAEFASFADSANAARVSRENSDESSFDMLEFARKADPETVAAQEAEFERRALQDLEGWDLHLDGQAASGSVASSGSLAATVGDKSAFSTSQEDSNSAKERTSSGLKREMSELGERPRKMRKVEV